MSVNSGPGMFGRALPPIPMIPGKKPPVQSVIAPEPRVISVDFFLPTGMMVTMKVNTTDTLAQLKEGLFREAKAQPLFKLLKDQSFYNFLGITQYGEKEEFVNESQCYSDLDLYVPILKLVERQGNQGEKLLNAEISNLIGRRLHDFDIMGAEVQDFRRNILSVCEDAVEERTASDRSMVLYSYPPNLGEAGRDEIDGVELIEVDVCFTTSDGRLCKTLLNMDLGSSPTEIVERAMDSRELKHLLKNYRCEDLVLKVVGREEYMLKEKRLSSYKYIHQCIAREQRAQLSLKLFQELVPTEKDEFIRPVFFQNTAKPAGGGQDTYTWDIKDLYRIKILSAKNVNVAENQKVFVRAGIYHGSEAVCTSLGTSQGASPEAAEWNEILEFTLPLNEIPRASKLCFVILGANEAIMAKNLKAKKRRNKEIAQVAWVNTTVFNYEGQLQTGKLTLYAWPIESELEESVHYMGSTVLNPSTTECVSLDIEIMKPNAPPTMRPGAPIMYPSTEKIRALAAEISTVAATVEKFPPQMVKDLQKVVEQDPLAQLDEQDKEIIWKMRNVCQQQFPQSLPKLLQSVNWNNRTEVAQMYVMLENWQQLTPETAMELLDYQYADIKVRDFAVDCLEVLNDEMLSMYLLQLVQVLKFEAYLDCQLGKFLLRRALKNKTIGHFFFWHLRSEMHLATVSVRYGLMLEAFCRGCGQYMKELSDQLTALNKMKQITDRLQSLGKKKTDDLVASLSDPHFTNAMKDITSPLDPAVHLKILKVSKCKVMDSKMRPLWLVFQNQDSLGDDILQIFKNGDDLRQDMLTLQIMTIMDTTWKQAGLDLRMNPYGCLSTGDQVGMIEVVLNSTTIAKIQKKARGARGAFDKKLLYQWLMDQNPDPVSKAKAIDNFIRSCAGCCVATYVLGIGDRHSDNIMLRKNGQLVHIDFGHFLGNFKSKFGVKRERVPFVLTDDFIYIITKAGTKSSPEFEDFKKLCEDAFLKLRESGPLFLNLFTMMMSCGIPELQTRDDISYIRDALCLGESKQAALENFRGKLSESLRNSWSVSLNWYFHNVARAGN